MSTSAFKGFEDTANDFFSVYRTLFDQIEEEELAFGAADNVISTRTTFGSSINDWNEELHAPDGTKVTLCDFYRTWGGYATLRTFAWVDKWNLAEAADRLDRRAMVKENLKAREVKRREWNELVRNLVAFVRRRDPRVQRHLEEAQALKLAQALEQKARVTEAKRQSSARLSVFREQDWMKTQTPKDLVETQVSGEESEAESTEFFCAPCKKVFRTENSWINHEKSKKHLAEMRRLR